MITNLISVYKRTKQQVTIKMTTKMLVNDESTGSISPLLTRPTHDNDEIIEIEPSNNKQTDLPLKNRQTNGIHKIPIDENVLKSMIISFDKINYTIGQTTNIKSYHKWKNMFSICKQTLNKQILFNLSGVFTPGMNAILGICFIFID